MKMNDAFPIKYLDPDDIDQKNDTVFTITRGGFEEVGQIHGHRCPVIYFKEVQEGFVLNKTNLGHMLKAHGATDTEELKGKTIALYVDHEVSFKGETVGGICVRAQAPEEKIPF